MIIINFLHRNYSFLIKNEIENKENQIVFQLTSKDVSHFTVLIRVEQF